MLKKSLIISLGLFGLLFSCSLLFQSCKCEEKVCNFSFNATSPSGDSLNLNMDDGIDTSLNELRFEFFAFNEHDNPACAWTPIGFNTAYAYTRYCEVLNPIVAESYTIQLNKDLHFNSDTILAGTNLFNYPAFKNQWNLSVYDGGKNNASINGSIVLDSTIYNQIQFDTGSYNVTFGFTTEDGQNLKKTLDVVYKL